MLKAGIIGNIHNMATLMHVLKGVQGVQVVGKSSMGIPGQTEAKIISIPEYNRHDLFDVADILIIDDSQLIHFDLFKSAVKNNKHLYFSNYPDLSAESSLELMKLADEAKTGIYVRNSLMSEPLTSWIMKNLHEPVYLGFFESIPALPDKKSLLMRYLLYAQLLFKESPQKIRAGGIGYPVQDFCFINFRFEYATSSAMNLEVLVQPKAVRTLKAAMPGIFLEGNCITGKAMMNMTDFPAGTPVEDSIVTFLKDPEKGNFYSRSNINAYYTALLTYNEVVKKTVLYTPWQ